MNYSGWERLLSARFPSRDAVEVEREWVALKQQFSFGQSVSGVVVAKAPFGAWVDIGCGFPALLEIVCVAGLTPERYRSDDWCAIGSDVTAFVGGFNDTNHQVGLWQVRVGEQKNA